MRWVAFMFLCAFACGQSPKNYKDHGEYDLYNEVAKDFAANNSSKALTDLERWSEKYPDSEFKDDRQMLYVQAYAGVNQMAKAIDAAGILLAKDQPASDNSASMLRLLYAVVSAIQHVPDATAPQIATAAKAAHLLENYDTAPDGISAPVWSPRVPSYARPLGRRCCTSLSCLPRAPRRPRIVRERKRLH